jgi:hypothetical protein
MEDQEGERACAKAERDGVLNMIASMALGTIALWGWLKGLRPYQRGPAYVLKSKAKLRAKYRQKLRSPKLRGDAKERRIYRQLMSWTRKGLLK